MASDYGRMANHGHCGAEACDYGRRTVIPVWVRQDTTVRVEAGQVVDSDLPNPHESVDTFASTRATAGSVPDAS
jgi:hypothetical protein